MGEGVLERRENAPEGEGKEGEGGKASDGEFLQRSEENGRLRDAGGRM